METDSGLGAPSRLIALVASLLLTTPSFALTWADVQAKALSTAPDLQSQRANIHSSDAAIDTAMASFYPTLSSTISATRNVETQVPRSANSYAAGLTLEQNLFSSGRDLAWLNAAKSAKDAALKETKAASVALRAKLAKAWTAAVYLQQLTSITAKNITRRESNARIVTLRYSNGRENKGSVLKTEAQTLEAKVSSLETVAKATLSKGTLSVLIGQLIPETEALVGPLAEGRIAPPNQKIVPVIAAKESQLQAAEDSLILAKTQYLPSLSLSASAHKSATPNLPLNAPAYSAQLALNIPIFNAATSAGVRSAAAKTEVATIELAAVRSSQEQSIKLKFADVEFSKKRLDVARKNFAADELQAEIYRQRYTLGLASFQDWNTYESALIASEMDVLSSEKSVADALTEYHEEIGVTLEEIL
jgi:outer membrane protein TolC